jgi:Tol biopolymer transport system component
MNMQRGASEKRVIIDQKTGREIWQMTCSSVPSLHSYYDLCVWSPDGKSIVFCSLNDE